MATLEEIERQIAELEKEVGGDDSSESEEDEEELLSIPKLPPHLICAPGPLIGITATNYVKPSLEDATDSVAPSSNKPPSYNKRIECKVCDNSVYWGEEAFRKHSRTVKHRQNVILKAGATYEAANKESNYCRACNFKAEDTEKLMLHRQTAEHREAASALQRASFCQLCKKQFTSPLQLREHIIGKAHKDKVELKTGRRPTDEDDIAALAQPTIDNNNNKRQRQ